MHGHHWMYTNIVMLHKLNQKIIDFLVAQPETGMGYQKVMSLDMQGKLVTTYVFNGYSEEQLEDVLFVYDKRNRAVLPKT